MDRKKGTCRAVPSISGPGSPSRDNGTASAVAVVLLALLVAPLTLRLRYWLPHFLSDPGQDLSRARAALHGSIKERDRGRVEELDQTRLTGGPRSRLSEYESTTHLCSSIPAYGQCKRSNRLGTVTVRERQKIIYEIMYERLARN